MSQDPAPESGTRKDMDTKSRTIKVRAKEYLVLYGIEYRAGNVIELPEREGLALVGTGQAEQIPEGAPAEEISGTSEQVAEAIHKASSLDPKEGEDAEKVQQLEKQTQKASEQAPLKRK